MKKFIILATLILSSVYFVNAQEVKHKTVFSDEYNFMAYFPEIPTFTEGDVNTIYGKGYSRNWKLELPDIVYELSVSDFPNLSIETDRRSLNTFYKTICNDFASQNNADCGTYNSVAFFGEKGFEGGGRSKEFFVNTHVYLINNRLYQLKVISLVSLNKDSKTINDISNFLNDFIFIYKSKDEKKYCYGLPQTNSQSSKPKECTSAFTLREN